VDEVEVTAYFPPFLLTSILAVLIFLIAREKLSWGLLEASVLAVLSSSLIGAIAYVLMAAVLGCPPCS